MNYEMTEAQEREVTQLESEGWVYVTSDEETVYLKKRDPKRRYSTWLCQVDADGSVNGYITKPAPLGGK